MTLNQKKWLCASIMAIGIVLSLLANTANANNADSSTISILVALTFLCLMGGMLLHFKLVRCPHCSTWVGKHPGEF